MYLSNKKGGATPFPRAVWNGLPELCEIIEQRRRPHLGALWGQSGREDAGYWTALARGSFVLEVNWRLRPGCGWTRARAWVQIEALPRQVLAVCLKVPFRSRGSTWGTRFQVCQVTAVLWELAFWRQGFIYSWFFQWQGNTSGTHKDSHNPGNLRVKMSLATWWSTVQRSDRRRSKERNRSYLTMPAAEDNRWSCN